MRFRTNRFALDFPHTVSDLHLNLQPEAIVITAAYFVEIKEKLQKLLITNGLRPSDAYQNLRSLILYCCNLDCPYISDGIRVRLGASFTFRFTYE